MSTTNEPDRPSPKPTSPSGSPRPPSVTPSTSANVPLAAQALNRTKSAGPADRAKSQLTIPGSDYGTMPRTPNRLAPPGAEGPSKS